MTRNQKLMCWTGHELCEAVAGGGLFVGGEDQGSGRSGGVTGSGEERGSLGRELVGSLAVSLDSTRRRG